MQSKKELPQYQNHAVVSAIRVASIHSDADGRWLITPVLIDVPPFEVGAEYVQKHNPVAGGYYVTGADGEGFIPASAFERDHTLISTGTQLTDAQAARLFALCGEIASIRSTIPMLPAGVDSRDMDFEIARDLRETLATYTATFVELGDILATVVRK